MYNLILAQIRYLLQHKRGRKYQEQAFLLSRLIFLVFKKENRNGCGNNQIKLNE